jgi:hypothetical protein
MEDIEEIIGQREEAYEKLKEAILAAGNDLLLLRLLDFVDADKAWLGAISAALDEPSRAGTALPEMSDGAARRSRRSFSVLFPTRSPN